MEFEDHIEIPTRSEAAETGRNEKTEVRRGASCKGALHPNSIGMERRLQEVQFHSRRRMLLDARMRVITFKLAKAKSASLLINLNIAPDSKTNPHQEYLGFLLFKEISYPNILAAVNSCSLPVPVRAT